ncbi:Kinesin light chain [Echinococcus granulosus]|uniref:Kinesin light chain n=1 Tax=Echinococcus granulosus TaxID=6210 RepID=W6ULX7_ECHGR|nr:Kinesin light chain [Echinococcus granulosus]EUB62048.1 Kinesin light chain [Echinococcus granulosus]
MDDFSQSEIMVQLRSSMKVLDSLRNEHKTTLRELLKVGETNGQPKSPKAESLEFFIDKIERAMGDGDELLTVSDYLQISEAEKQRLKAQSRRLLHENRWLREELASLQAQYRQSQVKVVALEEEINNLKFANEMAKYDAPDQSGLPGGDAGGKDIKSGDVQDKDESDQDVMSSSQTTVLSQIINNYEIPARLRTLHNLVIQYASEGRYEVAVPLCKQALEDLERTSGRDHPDVATMLNILALVYRDQNKYKEAAHLLNEALVIRERHLGPDHPAVAATLNNLAVLYGKRGKYMEAEPLCKRALEIREKVLGSDHPDVAKQLNNLALLCQNQGKYAEGLQDSHYYGETVRSAAVHEIAPDPYHLLPSSSSCFTCSLHPSFRMPGVVTEFAAELPVERYYQRALNIYTVCLGPNDPNVTKTKTNLASAYLKQAKYAEAEALYKDILTRAHELEYGKLTNENKPIWMLAEDRQNGKWDPSLASQAMAQRTALMENPTVATTLRNLGALYRRSGKFDAAEVIEECAGRPGKAAEVVRPFAFSFVLMH